MSLVVSQAVDSPLTRAAIFLVVAPGRPAPISRDQGPAPRARHAGRPAVSHARHAARHVLELAAAIMSRLEDAATVVDEVHGFKFFDERDLLGFVDGTENPSAQAAVQATLIGDEDPGFTGGSYVIIHKYLHNLKAWNALPVERQETIIGRKKPSDIEQRPFDKASYAHNVLTNIEEGGQQLQILRDNMPFGQVGKGLFGTYFIGYARSPDRIEKMLNNMFIGNPPGNYDRILDFSTAVTGGLFFVPGVVSGRCGSAGREGVNFRKL